ncbi:hypothetical protein M5D96_004647, partial [Drosophila gunungcola]
MHISIRQRTYPSDANCRSQKRRLPFAQCCCLFGEGEFVILITGRRGRAPPLPMICMRRSRQCGKRKNIPRRTVVAACPNKRQIAAVRTMGLICNS